MVGGPEYAGTQYPAGYTGTVFYGDYEAGTISRLTVTEQDTVSGSTPFATGWTGGVQLEANPAGDLVYVDIGTFSNDGTVREVWPRPPWVPRSAASTAPPG